MSLAISGREIVDVPFARAAKTRARFVTDLEPGMRTVAVMEPLETGAGHRSLLTGSGYPPISVHINGRVRLMCGRYALPEDPDRVGLFFDASTRIVDAVQPNFNVSPTQTIYVVDEMSNERLVRNVAWGLVPRWAKDASRAASLINARCESIAEKPSFREPFVQSRCLIPALGWYEWNRPEDGSKIPYFIYQPNQVFTVMAGILEAWKNPETGEWLRTAAVVTRDASKAMEHIHDRMPVLVDRADWSTWLKGTSADASSLFMKEHEIASHRVSMQVNSSRNNGRELIEAVA